VKPAVLVLGYHSISPAWPAVTSVRPRDFEDHLAWLVRRGFRGATLTDALTAPPHPLTLVVTFDDAHRSVLTHARPVLARLGLPATVFVPTGYPDSGRPMAWAGYDRWVGTEHEHELRCLTWDELRRLAAEGWEIGSHTRTHPRLTSLGDEALAAELVASRLECESAIGGSCRSLAYPYSDVDARVARAARAAGYALAVTIPRTAAAPLPLSWPRVGLYHGEGVAVLRRRIWRRSHPLLDAGIGAVRRLRARDDR
jgi:peptidoglycan/xylan/chitin deacetylase (PgdA/CDA1 family)